MAQIWELMQVNLLSPMVLAFVLGMIVVFIKSDLRLPKDIVTAMSVYLLFSIGLEGGFDLGDATIQSFIGPALIAIALGATIPVMAYLALTRFGKLSSADALAVGIHYGGVSSVSLSAGIAFLNDLGVNFEGFLPTLYVIMELPAFFVALLLIAWRIDGPAENITPQGTATMTSRQRITRVLRLALSGKTFLLLAGGVVIGLLSGEAGKARVEPFFFDLFPGILTLFLLQMGTVVGERISELRYVNFFVILYAILAPVVNAGLAIILGTMVGLSVGGAFILGIIAASASFISAPVVVRANLPQANPGIHMTTALVITFPFNLVFGLPIYYQIANAVAGIG
ncbi:MAG: sodium-dependent bicarbonate transport family permease [Chloroflexota bacterium]